MGIWNAFQQPAPADIPGSRVVKHKITAVVGQVVTLDVGGTAVTNVRCPASLTPAVNQWAWCIQQGTHLWPFALD